MSGSSVSFQQTAVTQPCNLLCGAGLNGTGTSSFSSLSGGSANIEGFGGGLIKESLKDLTPKRGRMGIEEIPYLGQEPVPTTIVPPPRDGWGNLALAEDTKLGRRFTNRNTQGLDGGGRSTDITRFTPQIIQYQQPDDLSRIRMFERNSAPVKRNTSTFV